MTPQNATAIAASIQALAAIILLVVTVRYVILTGRVAAAAGAAAEAARHQAELLGEQVGLQRQELEEARRRYDAQQREVLESQSLARQSMDEATRARLITTMPVLSVEVRTSATTRRGSTSFGTVPPIEFRAVDSLWVVVTFAVFNHGPGPARVAGQPPAVGQWQAWQLTDGAATTVIAEKATSAVEWRWVGVGEELLEAHGQQLLLTLRCDPMWPTGVEDYHQWVGTFQCDPDTATLTGDEVCFIGAPLADLHRRMPPPFVGSGILQALPWAARQEET